LLKLAEDTKRFIKSHPNIIFTRADKNNVTDALNKDFYINQINEMLQDETTYTIMNKDLTKKLISELRTMLT